MQVLQIALNRWEAFFGTKILKSMEAYFVFTFFVIMCGVGPMRKYIPLTVHVVF